MRPTLPYKLSIIFGVIVLTREIISLAQQIQRLRRSKYYDANRRPFQSDYHPYHREEKSYERPFGQTYDHKNDSDNPF